MAIANPGFKWYKHMEILGDRLEDCVAGRIKRLAVFMPPRHGKSELISRGLPGYILHKRPTATIGIASYASGNAFEFSGEARDAYLRSGGKLRFAAAGLQQWKTEKGGQVWAAGVGGTITGRGWHFGILDDPIKGMEQALSDNLKEKRWGWYRSTWYNRRAPEDEGVCEILVQTRWAFDDLAGRLLELLKSDEYEDDPWHIVNFPAISGEGYEKHVWPGHCTVEPEFREAPGLALCPERYSIKRLRATQSTSADHWWPLYQQIPQNLEGGLFKDQIFERCLIDPAEIPTLTQVIRRWDFAATENGGDWTVGALIGVDEFSVCYLLDVVRGQWGPDEVNEVIVATAKLDGVDVTVSFPQDPGQAGKKDAHFLTRDLNGFSVTEPEQETGAKPTRAKPVATAMRSGNFRIVSGKPWLDVLKAEMLQFPKGNHDDQVDAVGGGYNEIMSGILMVLVA